jgi:hypothetical protein
MCEKDKEQHASGKCRIETEVVGIETEGVGIDAGVGNGTDDAC